MYFGHRSTPLTSHIRGHLLQLILPHMVNHTFMAFHVPLQTLQTPWTIFVPLMFPRSSLKTCHQRKFQLKMGLLTLIQIPCHHVLANEIALNLKYRIGLKHFFNINLGISIIKKIFFVFCIFDISPCVFTQILIKTNEYPLGILLTDPATPKTRNTWKNVMMMSSLHFFRYFLFLGQRGPSKLCQVGTRWMWNLIPDPTSSPDRNLSKNTGRYVKNTSKKSSFFYDTYPQIYIKKVFKTYRVFQIQSNFIG